MFVVSIVCAAAAGAALGAQKIINAALAVRIGCMGGSFFNHAVGALFAGCLLLLGIRTGSFSLGGVPFHYFLGGCIGVFSIALVNYSIPRIGAMATVLCLILCQLITSCFIDHCGFLGSKQILMTPARYSGVILILVGAVLVLMGRRGEPSA